MAIPQTEHPLHWNYFISLEEDLERLSRFVEFSPANYRTHSIEMVRLLLSACSEVDVVAKALCERLEPSKKPDNINRYRSIIRQHIPKFYYTKISMPRFGLEMKPWYAWQHATSNPLWWTEHNGVKHDRTHNFSKAHLKNTLNATAGLFVLLIELYRRNTPAIQLEPVPRLFTAASSVVGRAHTLDGRTVLYFENI